MGTFVSNLQVRVQPDGPDATRARLREAILAYATANGMHVCSKEEADRSFAILTSERWLTLLDDALDAQDEKVFEQVGSALGLPCVAVLVHDGDELLTRGFGEKRERWKKVEPGEDALDEAVRKHGWDPEHAWLSFQYLEDATSEPELLHFREKNPPVWRRKVTGPPAFEKPMMSQTGGIRFERGAAIDRQMFFTVTPRGGRGTGMQVVLFGTALDAIRFEHATLGTARQPFEEVTVDGRRMAVATFDDAVIPAAIAEPEGMRDSDAMKYMDARHATELLLRLGGVAENEHRGWLAIAVRPVENPEGAAYNRTEIFIGTPRRPLTSTDATYADMLDRPFTLIGHAMLSSIDVQAVTAAAKRWNQLVLRDPSQGAWLADHREGHRSDRFVVSPFTLTEGTAWVNGIGKGQLHLGLFRRSEDQPLRDAVGLHTDRGIAGIDVVQSPPQLLLWRVVRYLDDEEASALERDLSEIVGALPHIEQAYVARWVTASTQVTSYERACGVRQVHDATRTLRGVSERMWLGPSMLARVDMKELERVAKLTVRGSSTRLELRDTATLDDLERVLMPLLPRG